MLNGILAVLDVSNVTLGQRRNFIDERGRKNEEFGEKQRYSNKKAVMLSGSEAS